MGLNVVGCGLPKSCEKRERGAWGEGVESKGREVGRWWDGLDVCGRIRVWGFWEDMNRGRLGLSLRGGSARVIIILAEDRRRRPWTSGQTHQGTCRPTPSLYLPHSKAVRQGQRGAALKSTFGFMFRIGTEARQPSLIFCPLGF